MGRKIRHSKHSNGARSWKVDVDLQHIPQFDAPRLGTESRVMVSPTLKSADEDKMELSSMILPQFSSQAWAVFGTMRAIAV